MRKVCSICYSSKEIRMFHMKLNGLHGVDSHCKSCVSQLKKKKYNQNKYSKQAITNQEELLLEEDVLNEDVISLFLKLIR